MSNFYRTFLFFNFIVLSNFVNAQIVVQDTVQKDESENIGLKLNLEQGSQYRFSTKSTQNLLVEMVENTIETNTEKTTQYLFEIVSNTEKGLEVKAFCERIAILTEATAKEEFKIDTDLPQSEQNFDFYPFYLSIINQPFYIFIDQHGEFLKTEGFTDLLKIPEMKDSEFSTDSLMMATLFSDLKNSFSIFPKDSVSMGSTWGALQKDRIGKEINFDIEKSFTLETLSEDLAWINVNHQIANSSLNTDLTLSGTQQGTIEVERNSGLVLYSDVQQEIEGEINVAGLMVPLKISSTIKITGEKL